MPRAACRLVMVIAVVLAADPCLAEESEPLARRLAQLEARLHNTLAEVAAMTRELEALKDQASRAAAPRAAAPPVQLASLVDGAVVSFQTQVIGSPRDALESSRPMAAKPEFLVQPRFSAFPIENATLADYSPNFRVSRMSMRWAGMVDDRWGAGVELQYRAAPDAVPEQLLNDAYLDLHVNRAVIVRMGQFVKPFGFDVQQTDVERESPERAMFAGYLFPGQRDRGVMVSGDLAEVCGSCQGVSYAAAIVNGNRFFSDSNRRANYLFRVRKTGGAFAIGASAQLGTQPIPPGVEQTNHENAYGVDAQWTRGRAGVRAEFVHANRPSTLLAPTTVFAPAFVAGARVRSVGTSVTGLWSLAPARLAYLRFNRFAGDVIDLCPGEKDGSCKINSVNGGLKQRIAGRGEIGVDIQWKNRLSFEHDAVNTALQVTSSLFF